MKIRVSQGSAVSLGLMKGSQLVPPTTLYLMLGEACNNNCAFCTQASGSKASPDRLSRVMWPEFEWRDVLDNLEKNGAGFRRACFQTLSYPGMLDDLVSGIQELKAAGIRISAAVRPLEPDELEKLEDAGLDRIGISLDAASKSVFDEVKGELAGNSYTWEEHHRALDDASKVFKARTSTHLIIGMGESDADVLAELEWCLGRGITVGLFAFTPFPGIRAGFSEPDISRYRALQAVRYLLTRGLANPDDFELAGGKLSRIGGIEHLEQDAFMTSGCPDCNRPFYNERVSGPIFNHPAPLTDMQYEEAINHVNAYAGR